MAAPPKVLCGIVVSSGKMMSAVKVRTAKQVYNKFLKKHFLTHQNHLVSDPTSATRTGDVVRIAAEGQVSRHIKHVVTEIIAPWGPAIEQRPAVLSAQQRVRIKTEKKEAKLLRRGKRAEKEVRELREERGKEAALEAEGITETEDDHVEGMVEGTQVAS
ncbi:MAG: hypothetical protein Q9163_004546 [Psora crenata]